MSRPTDTQPPPGALTLLAGAYLLSGLCSLAYQAVWIHRFSRLFGSTVLAASAVVAVFFGGLALGSRLLGHVSPRLGRPVRAYGLLEIGIALWAAAFPLLASGAEAIYSALWSRAAGSPAALTLLRVLLAAAVLLPPTVLRGGTLPVLLRPFVPRLDAAGRGAGHLYGVNALGAAAGSLLAGLVLIRHLGALGANLAVAALNLVIGLAALAVARRLEGGAAAKAAERTPASPDAITSARGAPGGTPAGPGDRAMIPGASLVLACFTVSGFVSMAFEIIWLRHLTFFFQDTIELYTGIIAIFILGLAGGSLLAARAASRTSRPAALLGALLAGIALTALVSLHAPVPHRAALFAWGGRGPLHLLAALAGLLLVPTLLMGATFPVVSRLVTPSARQVGDHVGRAYALNTAGGIAGLLAAGFLLFDYLGMQHTLYLLAGCSAAAAVALLAPRQRVAGALVMALALAYPLLVETGTLGRLPHRLLVQTEPGSELLAVREGATGTTWATRSAAGGIRVMQNNVVIARQEGGFAVLQGFVPMLIAPEIPRRVLGLAFGAGLSSYAPRLFPEVREMEFVDISPENVEVALRLLPENRGLAGDPRARIVIDDATSLVRRAPGAYDLVYAEPTPPMFSFRNAVLYTREFYAGVRDRLAPGGLFAQVLPAAQLSPDETAGVMSTFASVFPHCLLWWNHTDMIMIGAHGPFAIDLRQVQARLARPAVRQALEQHAAAASIRQLDHFLAGLLLWDDAFRAVAAGGDIYTEDRLGLQYASGRHLGPANLDRIQQNLTPWDALIPHLAGRAGAGLDPGELTARRQRYVTLSYTPYPARYGEVALDYIQEHSTSPRQDLTDLHAYLTRHGLHAQAARVAAMLAASP